MEVDDIFGYDWGARASLRAVGSTEPEARAMPVRLGLLASRQNELPMI